MGITSEAQGPIAPEVEFRSFSNVIRP